MYLSPLIMCFNLGSVYASLASTHLLVTHVGPCDSPGSVELPMTLRELTITTQLLHCSLTGVFNLTQDVANGWKVKATMQKCQDIRNVDTCDFFNEYYVVNDGCSEDSQEEETYIMMFHYVNPDLECPIRAGVYKLTEYPFFTEDNFITVYESKISTSVFGYTYRLEGFTVDDLKIFCVEAYLQLLYMREHNWVDSKHNITQASKRTQDEERKNSSAQPKERKTDNRS